MSESLEYIDNYFSGALSPSEKSSFESRCESDKAFADEVAFYVSARALIEAEYDLEKKKEFDALHTGGTAKKGTLRRLFPYLSVAAAACAVIFLGWMFFFNEPSSKQLADDYIRQHFQTISTSLGGNKDSLENGKIAFNKKNYAEAEKIFSDLSSGNNINFDALEYLGIVYLVTGKYNQAIFKFDRLSNERSLHANYGAFYKAVALIKRDKKGDHDEAKTILNRVINESLPGNEEAKEWIRKF